VRGILAELPETLDATYERILQEIPKPNRVHAHRLLQCLATAVRPLEVEELAEVLAIDFDVAGGIPKLNGDLRWADQEHAVLSACSSLIAIIKDRGSRRVQFSHFSVKEYLSSDRLATSEMAALRFHHIHLESAHAIMAQACLGVLLQLNDSMDKKTIEGYPLAEYAGEFFNDHAEAGDVLSQNNDGVDHLLDPDGPHFNPWLWLQRGDTDQKDLDVNLDSISEWDQLNSDKSSSEHPFPTYPPRASPLYYTISFEHHYLTRHLILKRPHDLQLYASDVYGKTPLHLAIVAADFEAIRMLLDRTADVNVRDNRGYTPLHYGAFENTGDEDEDDRKLQDDDFRCVRLLLERGADTEAQNNRGTTPLHVAASVMRQNFVQILTENVTNINLRNDQGQTALHKASRRCHPGIISILLNHGADVDAQDNGGSTPLHIVISDARPLDGKGDTEQAVGVLLEHGADINLRNHEGQTALHQASRHDDTGYIMHLLLKHGPDVNALDNNGSTPLHLAISYAHHWIVEQAIEGAVGLFLEHGANINLRNGQGQTALHKASLLGYPDIIHLMLNHGAEVDAQDNDGLTPLHLIISKVSMDSEASKDSEDSEEYETFKDFEASEDSETSKAFVDSESLREVIKLLLEHGASVHRENNRGETPLQVAAVRGLQEITGLLSMHFQNEGTA
jgi:ankyrin repeat protein